MAARSCIWWLGGAFGGSIVHLVAWWCVWWLGRAFGGSVVHLVVRSCIWWFGRSFCGSVVHLVTRSCNWWLGRAFGDSVVQLVARSCNVWFGSCNCWLGHAIAGSVRQTVARLANRWLAHAQSGNGWLSGANGGHAPITPNGKKGGRAQPANTPKNRETHDNAQIKTAHDLQRRIRQAERRQPNHSAYKQTQQPAEPKREENKRKKKQQRSRGGTSPKENGPCAAFPSPIGCFLAADLSAGEQYIEPGMGASRGYQNRQTRVCSRRRVD